MTNSKMYKPFIVLVFILVNVNVSIGQTLRFQSTPYFHFKTFERKNNISQRLDSTIRNLQNKSVEEWTSLDSLNYGLELILLSKYDQSLNYILRVSYDQVDDLERINLIEKSFLINKEYKKLYQLVLKEKEIRAKVDKELIYRIKIARSLALVEDEKWKANKSIIFPELLLINKKNTSRSELISIARDMDNALRSFVYHINRESNELISEAYEEFGDFLLSNFNQSNAFIAYSMSRYYFNRNRSVSLKIKRVKSWMEENHFILPSFRKVFGKIQPGRFNYQLLKKQAIENENKEIPKIELPKKKEKDLVPFLDTGMILILGFASILLFVILFVRVRK